MGDVRLDLGHWQLGVKGVREFMYHAPTCRERERWHAVWLLSHGCTVSQVAEALERDVRTIGEWLVGFQQRALA